MLYKTKPKAQSPNGYVHEDDHNEDIKASLGLGFGLWALGFGLQTLMVCIKTQDTVENKL